MIDESTVKEMFLQMLEPNKHHSYYGPCEHFRH